MTTSPSRRAVLATGSAALAAAFVASCSGSSAKTTPGSTSGAGGGGSKTPLVFYGGGTGSFTANFNPFSSTFNNGARGMVYEPLMFFNQLKPNDVEPWLAKGYKLSADGRTITFDLQTGVTWSDGQPLTAADVVYTFDLLRKTPALNTNGLKIVSAKATDDHTVVLQMGQAAYTDIWYIAGGTYIVPQHIWSKKTDPATDQDSKPVGSGAYVLSTFSPQSYLMTPNAKYFQGAPQVTGIRFVNYSGNTAALQALQAGTVDLGERVHPPGGQAVLRTEQGFPRKPAPGHGDHLPDAEPQEVPDVGVAGPPGDAVRAGPGDHQDAGVLRGGAAACQGLRGDPA